MVRVRGVVNFFTPTLILPRQGGGRILRNSFNFSLSLPLRERIKVRGAVLSFPLTFFLSTPQERVRVRSAVNFFHPHLNPPPSMGRKLKRI
jgi:hypothetical protein